nr:MAG TPA: hypothetical protein [Caudoviricetes sp.]
MIAAPSCTTAPSGCSSAPCGLIPLSFVAPHGGVNPHESLALQR